MMAFQNCVPEHTCWNSSIASDTIIAESPVLRPIQLRPLAREPAPSHTYITTSRGSVGLKDLGVHRRSIDLRGMRATVVAAVLALLMSSLADSQQCSAKGQKSVYVIGVDDFQVKQNIENSVLKSEMTAYMPRNRYVVGLTPDQQSQLVDMNVNIDLLPIDQRLAPSLSTASQPGAQLIVELCANSDRDISVLMGDAQASLDAMQVLLEPVSATRLLATIQGSTPPAQVGRALIDLICEIVWIEGKSRPILF